MMGFKHIPTDALYNRRRFMVWAALYMVFWGIFILVMDVIFDLETGKVVAYLSYISGLSGTGILGYFMAANKDDRKKILEAVAGKVERREEQQSYTDEFHPLDPRAGDYD